MGRILRVLGHLLVIGMFVSDYNDDTEQHGHHGGRHKGVVSHTYVTTAHHFMPNGKCAFGTGICYERKHQRTSW